jgi:hypothetical protein
MHTQAVPLDTGVLQPVTGITPKRGQHIAAGDIVKPTPKSAYRVLSIEAVPGTIYLRGEWVNLNRRYPRPEPFTLVFIRWYTTVAVESGRAS